eukprot:10586240-Alexandrium_andersonii.AAC.1
MSASLVGSEMCIRDRNSCLLPARRRSASWSPGASGAPDRSPSASPAPGSCLLYTSDAADDM